LQISLSQMKKENNLEVSYLQQQLIQKSKENRKDKSRVFDFVMNLFEHNLIETKQKLAGKDTATFG